MALGRSGRAPRSIELADRNAELERLLIEGEVIEDDAGKLVRVYPLATEIAERLGVSKSWVSKYSKAHRCPQRQAQFKNSIKEKAREKVVETEAERRAFETTEQLALCDSILAKYQEAIEAREIGNVTAADINTLIRLRHFIKGDADSRSEVASHVVTLEAMQEAHARAHTYYADTSTEERGVMESTDEATGPLPEPLIRPFDPERRESEVDHDVDQCAAC
jgi:predicted transcriptional regulator